MHNPQGQDIGTSIKRIRKEQSSDEGKNEKFFRIQVSKGEDQRTNENAPGRDSQF